MTTHRREVLRTHYQRQLQFIVEVILQHKVESIVEYMYGWSYAVGIYIIRFIAIDKQAQRDIDEVFTRRSPTTRVRIFLLPEATKWWLMHTDNLAARGASGDFAAVHDLWARDSKTLPCSSNLPACSSLSFMGCGGRPIAGSKCS